jgi:hypothetical protein
VQVVFAKCVGIGESSILDGDEGVGKTEAKFFNDIFEFFNYLFTTEK